MNSLDEFELENDNLQTLDNFQQQQQQYVNYGDEPDYSVLLSSVSNVDNDCAANCDTDTDSPTQVSKSKRNSRGRGGVGSGGNNRRKRKPNGERVDSSAGGRVLNKKTKKETKKNCKSTKTLIKKVKKQLETNENNDEVENLKLTWSNDVETSPNQWSNVKSLKELIENNESNKQLKICKRKRKCKTCDEMCELNDIMVHLDSHQLFCRNCLSILGSYKKQTFVLLLTDQLRQSLGEEFVTKIFKQNKTTNKSASLLDSEVTATNEEAGTSTATAKTEKVNEEIGIYRGSPGDAVKKSGTRIWRQIRKEGLANNDPDFIERNNKFELTLRRRRFNRIVLKRNIKRTGSIKDFSTSLNCIHKKYDSKNFKYLVEMKKQDKSKLERILQSDKLKAMGSEIWYSSVKALVNPKNKKKSENNDTL